MQREIFEESDIMEISYRRFTRTAIPDHYYKRKAFVPDSGALAMVLALLAGQNLSFPPSLSKPTFRCASVFNRKSSG